MSRTALVTGVGGGIGPAVGFLTSEAAGWISGRVLGVDGGGA